MAHRAVWSEMGFSPVPSWANFVYCDVGEDSVAVLSDSRTKA